MGPYETETEAAAEALPREVRALYEAGQVYSGDPGGVVGGAQIRALNDVLERAGVELGAYERRVLEHYVGRMFDPTEAQALIAVIGRAAGLDK